MNGTEAYVAGVLITLVIMSALVGKDVDHENGDHLIAPMVAFFWPLCLAVLPFVLAYLLGQVLRKLFDCATSS